MATENIMMAAVKKGGNRQDIHEQIRSHSMEAAREVKQHGRPNDLMQRIAADSRFGLSNEQLKGVLDPRLYIGRSEEQTEEFLLHEVEPALARYDDWIDLGAEALRV